MAGKKIVIAMVLGSMLLGMSAPIVANLIRHPPARAYDPVRGQQLKAQLEQAIRTAEQAVGGQATAIRLDPVGLQPMWIVGVKAGSTEYDISIERDGSRIATILRKTGPAVPAPNGQGVSALSKAGGERL